MRKVVFYTTFFIIVFFNTNTLSGHEITFCGESIPLNEDFVVNRLMDVIRAQMPTANLPQLRKRALEWFPKIEKCLAEHGLPDDLKYLPIVESGFRNGVSPAGAYGFWQLMPETARDFNLIVNEFLDERGDPDKSTQVACKLMKRYYATIQRDAHTSSWILTAAAYNYGIGNILKNVQKQGTDYFSMNLNKETAEYVYKLIAIKELFENPEIYMNGFGRNVFSADAERITPTGVVKSKEFSSVNIRLEKPGEVAKKKKQVYYIPAHIVNDTKFSDGQLVTIELEGDLKIPGKFSKKGNVVKGNGWLIDSRVFIDIGYGHTVQVMDGLSVKGIAIEEMNTSENKILLKVEINS